MQAGSYSGLELNSIHDVMETQEDVDDEHVGDGALEIPSPTKEMVTELQQEADETVREADSQQTTGDLI